MMEMADNQEINISLFRCCKGLIAAENQHQLALFNLTKMILQKHPTRKEFLENKEIIQTIERAIAPEIIAEDVWNHYINKSFYCEINNNTCFIINTCREYWTNIIADHLYAENRSTLSDTTNDENDIATDNTERNCVSSIHSNGLISQEMYISETNTITSSTAEVDDKLSQDLLLSPSQWEYCTPSPIKDENQNENKAKRRRID